jgi:DNA helicase HerA-like ATPase
MAMADTTDDGDVRREITVGETTAGEPYTLPVEDLLTGRLFATGKSGAGKSNTASVIAEELLDDGHPLLIVDVDGEYWGIKETYEVLHVGATEECDLQIGPEHAGKIADLALGEHVPIVLDVSGYVDEDVADELVAEVARELFAREQQAMQPFLLLVEEIHEYLPQQGALGETGQILKRIAKRGRKRGLGIAGISQRPADVDKSFITQADLLVWHRLTWNNDTDVVQRVIDAEHADLVENLDEGEAFVQADWAEADVDRVQFSRKRTFDAGATPGLDDVERPELKGIDEDLVDELQEISDKHERRQDRIAELEARLEEKEETIAELEDELEDARDLQRLGEAFVDAAQSSEGAGVDAEQTELLEEKNEEIAQLREKRDTLQERLEHMRDRADELQNEVERLRGIEERVEQAEQIEQEVEEVKTWFANAPNPLRETAASAQTLFATAGEAEDVDVDEALQRELEQARDRIAELESELETARSGDTPNRVSQDGDLTALLQHEAVRAAIDTAIERAETSAEHFDPVLSVLATAEGESLPPSDIAAPLSVSERTVRRVLKPLHNAGVLQTKGDRPTTYRLDREFLESRIEVAQKQAELSAQQGRGNDA